MMKLSFDRLANGLASTFRNTINKLMGEIEENFTETVRDLNKAKADASAAVAKADEAKVQAESVQEQFNQVVIEGDSSVEAAQARVDAKNVAQPTLKARLDNDYNEVTAQLAETEYQVTIQAKKNKGIINLDEYAHLKENVSLDMEDWTIAVQTAIDEADEGQTILIPPNLKKYGIRELKNNGKSIYLQGHSERTVHIVQRENKSVINFSGSWGVSQSITNITKEVFTIKVSPTTVTKITLSSPPTNLSQNDVVKVFSDDLIPYSHDKGNRRKGEFAMVSHISGNDVYLSSLLRESYTTNPKIAKLTPNTFGLSNITFSTVLDKDVVKYTEPIVKLSSAMDCKLDNIHCTKALSSFIQLKNLCGYTASRITVNNLEDDTQNQHWGYGIQDSACEYGLVSYCLFKNCRHGFTTNGISSNNPNNNPENYGYSQYTNVTNCLAFGSTTTSFDTHPECYSIKFSDCQSSRSVGGFNARGKKVTFENCHSTAERIGFQVAHSTPSSTIDPGGTSDVRLVQCTAKDSTLRAINILDNGVHIPRITIDGGEYEVTDNESVIRIGNADVTLSGRVKLSNKSDKPYSRIFYLNSNAKLNLYNVSVELSNISGSNSRVFHIEGDNFSVIGDRLNVKPHETTSYLFARLDGYIGENIKLSRVYSDRFLPLAYNIGNYKIGFKSDEINTSSKASNEIYLDLAAGGESPRIDREMDRVIYLRVRALGADRSIGSFPLGSVNGQILVARNSNSSGNSYNVTIPNSAGTGRTQKSTITLAEGDVTMFIFIGGYWIHVNKI